MGFMHGTNDAQKTMGIIALALCGWYCIGGMDALPEWLSFLKVDTSKGKELDIPTWIKLTCAVVMAAGTAAGGWRIIKTLGHKMVKLQPVNGFAAETTSATIIGLASISLRYPSFHNAQYLCVDHGSGCCEKLERAQVDHRRADGLGVVGYDSNLWIGRLLVRQSYAIRGWM